MCMWTNNSQQKQNDHGDKHSARIEAYERLNDEQILLKLRPKIHLVHQKGVRRGGVHLEPP